MVESEAAGGAEGQGDKMGCSGIDLRYFGGMTKAPAIIDDMSRPHPMTPGGAAWEMLTDQVMGGISQGTLIREAVAGRPALRLRGGVRLENSGGFVQAALDLTAGGDAVDARDWGGIALTVWGNGERYNLHLRTDNVVRPWQSYRAGFEAGPEWTQVVVRFEDLEAHRVQAAFDPATLRRIGLVAIGRAFEADLAISDLRFVV